MKFNIITSFPKSGNTWLRYIIYDIFFNPQNKENNNSLDIQKFVPDLHAIKINNNQLILDKVLKDKKVFLKTHLSYNQMLKYPMDKIILIVRNPLDVFVSLCNFYDYDDSKKDELVDFFAEHHTLPILKKFGFPTWSQHTNNWVDSNTSLHIVRYKSLLDNFDIEIHKLSEFFGIILNREKLDHLKLNTSFIKLRNIEKEEKKNNSEGVFNHAMGKKKGRYFMNVGKNDNYKNLLNEDQTLILKESFGNYIDKYNL